MEPVPYSVTVRQRAIVGGLVSLEDVKARLGLGAPDDALLEAAIEQGSRAIEQFVGRPLALQTYREVTSAARHRQQTLKLSRWPVDPDSLVVTDRGEELDSDVTVAKPAHGRVFRSSGWPVVQAYDSEGQAQLQFDYRAGFLLPEAVSDWSTGSSFDVGDWVRPNDSSPFLFECTAGGSSGSDQPIWSTVDRGDGITDGSVTWTAVELPELPDVITLCAYLTVKHLTEDRPAGITSMRIGSLSTTYTAAAAEQLLPPNVIRTLLGWRW